ncbi:unnamed protein product, partial [Adineta steineri]
FAVINSSTTPLRRLYEHFQRRKLIWIIFLSICVVLITVVVTITILSNKTEKEKTSTTEITTSTISTSTTITITTKKVTTTSSSSTTTTTSEQLPPSVTINSNTKWKEDAITVAGGNGRGNELNQLNAPLGIHVDSDNYSIYIADTNNHRIVRWKFGADKGEIIAGGTRPGRELYQLNYPKDVILDKENKHIIICDHANLRVVRWCLQSSQNPQVLINRIVCYGLAMDNHNDLYISDWGRHQVRRWRQEDSEGTVIAGVNEEENQLN